MTHKFSRPSRKLWFLAVFVFLLLIMKTFDLVAGQADLLDKIFYPVFVIGAGLFLAELIIGYVHITDEYLMVWYFLWIKKLRLSAITKIDYKNGDYIFETPDKKIKVNRYKIRRKQRAEFDEFYEELNDNIATAAGVS